MKNIMKKLFAIAMLFVGMQLNAGGVQAAMMDHVIIKGQVVGLDKTVVTLKTTQGNVKVPRSFFHENEGVRIRMGRVMKVTTSLTAVVSLNSKK